MLNYLKRAALISLMSLLLFSNGFAELESSSANEQATPVSGEEATSVVSSYLSALAQGDTSTIKLLLGGKALEDRRIVLDNPSYANSLSKIYSNATSKVLGTEAIDLQNIAVDALIELSQDEILQCRFIVARDENQQLKIIEELEHSQL